MDAVQIAPRAKSRTYLPQAGTRGQIRDLARLFREIDALLGAGQKPILKGPDGYERELPQELFEVLEQVVNALASGNGVTVAPYGMQLTTQEAADFLGISRPTLVKLLEAGAIPHEMRGRHRRVTLRDLVVYQEQSRVERKATLRHVAREGQRAGATFATGVELLRQGDAE